MHTDVIVSHPLPFLHFALRTCRQQKLRDNKAAMKLGVVFGNPSREKSLFSVVKKTCSSVRNSFRQDVRAEYL